MTLLQIQCLLQYLGYYTIPVDGITGPGTRAAVTAFQKDFGGLVVDGIPGDATQKALRHAVAYGIDRPDTSTETAKPPDDFWADIQYFTREEFRCKCGGKYCNGFPVEPGEQLVRTLDAIRANLGVPITITSGIRCTRHNANVGGVSNSQHLYGIAADLHSSATPARMKAVSEEVMGNAGGIGLYSWGIHVDTRPGCSRWNG